MYKHQYWMKDTDHSDTYWGNNGKHQDMADALKPEVPHMGKADHPAIEVFRNMQNFYYDRYNNGHCNPCKTECAIPVRAFMKKHKAPSYLKFKIGVFDTQLEEACDWIISKCYELFTTGKIIPETIIPRRGDVVEMNDGKLVGVSIIDSKGYGNRTYIIGLCGQETSAFDVEDIKRIVPVKELMK